MIGSSRFIDHQSRKRSEWIATCSQLMPSIIHSLIPIPRIFFIRGCSFIMPRSPLTIYWNEGFAEAYWCYSLIDQQIWNWTHSSNALPIVTARIEWISQPFFQYLPFILLYKTFKYFPPLHTINLHLQQSLSWPCTTTHSPTFQVPLSLRAS